jgi:hypothetical protein
MTEEIDQLSKITIRPVSERFNQECFCVTLDRDALCESLEREVGDPDFCATFIRPRTHLFSNAPVFLSEGYVAEMLRIPISRECRARCL